MSQEQINLGRTMTSAKIDTCLPLRDEVHSVRMDTINHGHAGGWAFSFRGADYTVRDNNESPMAAPDSTHIRAWVIRQILDGKACNLSK